MLKSDAIKHFGTQKAIADAIGLTKAAVCMWPEVVPQGRAYELQFLTGGRLRVKAALYRKITRRKRRKTRTEHTVPPVRPSVGVS